MLQRDKKKDIIENAYAFFNEELNRILEDCREKSIAVTKLDEAFMWAICGIERCNDKDI